MVCHWAERRLTYTTSMLQTKLVTLTYQYSCTELYFIKMFCLVLQQTILDATFSPLLKMEGNDLVLILAFETIERLMPDFGISTTNNLKNVH